ncbi:hypothetical protein LINPERHAP2_LOCUS15971 [Linum perenne]
MRRLVLLSALTRPRLLWREAIMPEFVSMWTCQSSCYRSINCCIRLGALNMRDYTWCASNVVSMAIPIIYARRS